jgi:hypothetical protein
MMSIAFAGAGPKPCTDQLLGGCVCGKNGAATTAAAAAAGYLTLWDPPASWYLSCYADKCDTDGGGAGYESWEHIYAQEPFMNQKVNVSITDPAEQQRVIGGGASPCCDRHATQIGIHVFILEFMLRQTCKTNGTDAIFN